MSKPYTADDFTDGVTRDLTWRIREISDLKQSIRDADSVGKRSLLRALIPILYAHWEGFVRNSAALYFTHISMKRLRFSELESQIYINSFLARLDAFSKSKGGVTEKCEFITEVMNSIDQRFSWVNPAIVDTKANLNSDVMCDLCKVCGVPATDFDNSKNFLDVLILKRRNQIAHGEEVYIEAKDVDNLVDEIIRLMRIFKNLLENKVHTKLYRGIHAPA